MPALSLGSFLRPLRGCPVALSLFLAAAHAGHAQSADAWFADFPLVVFCEFNGIGNAYYLSQVNQEGVAIYLTPDRQAASITVLGTPQVVGGARSGSCKDRTIAELRASGEAFDLPR